MRNFSIVSLLALLVGCATTPTEPPKVSGSVIQFVRDSGLAGSGCTFEALVDGEAIGQLSPGDSLTKRVVSGRHRVEINNVSPICPNLRTTKVVDVLDSPVVFRVGFTMNQTIFDQIQ